MVNEDDNYPENVLIDSLALSKKQIYVNRNKTGHNISFPYRQHRTKIEEQPPKVDAGTFLLRRWSLS